VTKTNGKASPGVPTRPLGRSRDGLGLLYNCLYCMKTAVLRSSRRLTNTPSMSPTPPGAPTRILIRVGSLMVQNDPIPTRPRRRVGAPGVIFTTERVPVYNLSIPGSPTYYVGEHGVWVHNSGPCDISKPGAPTRRF